MPNEFEYHDLASRRTFLKGVLAAGGLSPSTAEGNSAEPASSFSIDNSGVVRTTQEKLRELPSIDDFGPVGDGKSDDWQRIQSALDWAGQRPGTRLRVPPRMYGLRRPLLVPESLELLGELPGAGNAPLCGFRALPGFESPYALNYGTSAGPREMPIAALLIAKEWTENAEFSRRLHLRDLFFDVDAIREQRGGPIHGMMLANQQLDLHNVWVRSATGFGIWINTQRPDGRFMRALVDNVLRRVWIRGAGVGGGTFQTDAGMFRYGGFLIGALPGARDLFGGAEPPLATDGILDYCTVAVGPEDRIGCRGNGIHITRSAGWRLTSCHLNGAGRHGVVLEKAFQTELSGCYLDGWAADVGDNEGTFGCIWCNSIVGLDMDADGGLIIGSNRIAARAVGSTLGNQFVAVSLRAGITPTARAAIIANVVVKRRHVDHNFAVFDFGRGGRGELAATVVGNIATDVASPFLKPWNESAVRPRFSGNSFQYATGAPLADWYPKGLRIENTAPASGGWNGWVCAESGSPGTWRGYGRIET
jgi:hypothetical protein